MAADDKKQTKIQETEAGGDAGIIVWPFLGIILVQILGVFIPDYLAWGVSFWQVISFPLSIILLLIAAALIAPPVTRAVSPLLDDLFTPVVTMLSRLPMWLIGGLASVAMVALFYIFRSRALVYGDGFMRLAEASDLVVGHLTREMSLQLPSVLLYHYTALLAHQTVGWTAETAFALVNCIGGVIGIWALYSIASRLSAERCGRWFILLATLCSGATILFFGYIEHYTWFTVIGLWSVYWALRCVQGTGTAYPMVLLSLLAAAFHVEGASFMLIAASALVIRHLTRGGRIPGRLTLAMSLAAIISSLGLALVFQLGDFQAMLVPVWPRELLAYSALSPSHLIDVLNELLLVAPVGVAAAVYLLVRHRRNRSPVSPTEAILILSAVITFLATFWLNPELGAPRDWDMLGVSGFPISLWGAYQLWKRRATAASCARCLIPVIVVAAVVLIPNLVEKNSLSLATVHLDDLLWHDAHYQASYLKAVRAEPWAFTLQKNVGDYKRAIKYYYRRIDADSGDFGAWRALGETWFFDRNVPDSGYYYLTQAATRAPDQADLWRKLAEVELKMGEKAEALKHAQLAVQLAPDDINMQSQLAAALASLGRYRDALGPLYQAYLLAPDSCEQLVNLGDLYSYLGVHDSAYYYLSRGLSLECRPEVAMDGLKSIFASELALGKVTEAAQALNQLSHMRVPTAEFQEMQIRLQKAAAASRGGG